MRLFPLLTVLILVSCKGTNEAKKMELKPITSLVDKEEGFEDIGLQITDKKIESDKVIFVGQGMFDNDTVGLKFETWKEYKAGVLKDGGLDSKSGYTSESVRIYSLGQKSNDFLKALGKLYNIPTSGQFSNKPIIASAFSLTTEHLDLTKSTGYFKSKLFLNENTDSLYCELYFNINLDKETIELPEKDLEYRENLIRTFNH
jgi:hypothetical protein